MFKDPYQNDTPYDLLALDVDTRMADVHAALPRFMRNPKNVKHVPQAQDAIKKLKSCRERAAIDIWLYDIEASAGELSLDGADDFGWLQEYVRVPVYEVDSLCSDLDAADLTADLPPIVASSMSIVELTDYDSPPDIGLHLVFDC